MKAKVPVAVLGATGMVGQQLLRLLEGHPWFTVAEVVASERNVGKAFGEVVRWVVEGEVPGSVRALILKGIEDPLDSPLVFSCLSAAIAQEAEPRLAARGHLVVSNASAFRLAPGVPLLIPEVNPHCLSDVRRWGEGGAIVTNPNCVVAGLVLALVPLHRVSPVRRCVVVTLQAASGAGVPGHPAVELLDNVIPWIEGEEEKIAQETAKLLQAPVVTSVSVHRVPVLHGHMGAVHVATEDPLAPEVAIEAWEGFGAPEEVAGLPSAPAKPVIYLGHPARPQPRVDRMVGGGMTVTVGRARACPAMGLAFEFCVHNLIRGAAGAALLNAELCLAQGLVP